MKNKLFLISVILILILSGCGSTGSKKKVYKYQNSKVVKAIQISQAVYKDNQAVFTIKGDISKSPKVSCYNKDFELIDCEWEAKYKGKELTVTGDKASEISGMSIISNAYRYDIRYLDSTQYAALCYADCTEIGYDLVDGDTELYYTEEEKIKQKEAREAFIKEQEEVWEILEGRWENENDPEAYLEFANGEHGKYVFSSFDGNGMKAGQTVDIAMMGINEQYDGTYNVYFEDNPDWGCRYNFDLSKEKDLMMLYGYELHKR